MSKERTTVDSNNDEETNEDSDLLFPQSDNVKRAKLVSSSDTTLQDLPMEVIERILFEIVVMEVKDMKLVKSVWKEKADLVISRLRTVCSSWNSILTTDCFRNEIHMTLDRTAPDTIRLEILHQFPIPSYVFRFTTMKDEIFITSNEENIVVYDRNNMAAPTDIIGLPGKLVKDVAACIVSNCLYALVRGNDVYSVLRIKKDETHEFKTSTWINDLEMRFYPSISVSAGGCLIILFWPKEENPAGVRIYGANGYVLRNIMLSPGIYCLRCVDNAIQKSNGNLLLVSFDDQSDTKLAEFDATGNIVRRYESLLGVQTAVHFADDSQRFVISELDDGIRLFDSEFNLLDFTGPPLSGSIMHYDYERNEVVSILSAGRDKSVLTIFRFADK